MSNYCSGVRDYLSNGFYDNQLSGYCSCAFNASQNWHNQQNYTPPFAEQTTLFEAGNSVNVSLQDIQTTAKNSYQRNWSSQYASDTTNFSLENQDDLTTWNYEDCGYNRAIQNKTHDSYSTHTANNFETPTGFELETSTSNYLAESIRKYIFKYQLLNCLIYLIIYHLILNVFLIIMPINIY